MWHCFRHIIDEEPSFRWLKTPAGQKAFHSHRNHYMCDVHQVQEEERFEMIGKAWVSNRAERSWAALVCGLPCSNVHFWIVGTILDNSTPLLDSTPLHTVYLYNAHQFLTRRVKSTGPCGLLLFNLHLSFGAQLYSMYSVHCTHALYCTLYTLLQCILQEILGNLQTC